jgi:hypothetical protein
VAPHRVRLRCHAGADRVQERRERAVGVAGEQQVLVAQLLAPLRRALVHEPGDDHPAREVGLRHAGERAGIRALGQGVERRPQGVVAAGEDRRQRHERVDLAGDVRHP